MQPIRILLADDHLVVRKGLRVFLSTRQELEIVGEAADGHEAVNLAVSLQPDIILMDLKMPGLDGIAATQQLRAMQPGIKVIVLTSFSDEDYVLPAIRAGVKGFLLKDVEPDELVRAIRRIHEGKVELHPDAAEHLVKLYNDEEPVETKRQPLNPLDHLTPRELEVLQLIAKARSNKEIADTLVITEKTVKTHVSHILDKLGLADRTQAAVYAIKQGLDDVS